MSSNSDGLTLKGDFSRKELGIGNDPKHNVRTSKNFLMMCFLKRMGAHLTSKVDADHFSTCSNFQTV